MDISEIKNNIKFSWQKIDKIDKIFFLLLIIIFTLKVITVFYLPIRGWDETVYLNLGYDLSKNPLNYSLLNSGWSDYIPSTENIYTWPNIGFRAPLLPYIFSVFYFIKLSFLIPFIIPFITTISIFLIYKLGQKLFNKKVGLYSALFFSLIPIHLITSEKIWTDAFVVFFILLTFISFWEGYEKDNKKNKILFGLYLALSLMARYTTLWITPVFLFYFIIRDKSFKFLKDKYLWYAILIFLLVLIPWFLYGIAYYKNPLGAFIHGFKAAGYWGGIQAWYYFIDNAWRIFSVIGILFIPSFFFILYKKEFLKKEIYLLLIWLLFFSTIVMIMPHKEERFIMPVIPVVCLISGFFISKLGKAKNIILGIITIILIISLINLLKTENQNSKDLSVYCFNNANKYLASDSIDKDSLVVTNQDPIVHYYTKKQILTYPNPWSLRILRNIINDKYKNKHVYIVFSNYDMGKEEVIKKDLDFNFTKVFECKNGWGYSSVYKYE